MVPQVTAISDPIVGFRCFAKRGGICSLLCKAGPLFEPGVCPDVPHNTQVPCEIALGDFHLPDLHCMPRLHHMHGGRPPGPWQTFSHN